MAKKPKEEKPARPRDSADDKKPRGKPVSLFPLTFDEAMRKLVRPSGKPTKLPE